MSLTTKMKPLTATIRHLQRCRELRRMGRRVAYTTDPSWLVDMAINRRAGWPDDPSEYRGSCRPINGRYPRRADGMYQKAMQRDARAVRHYRQNRIVRRGSGLETIEGQYAAPDVHCIFRADY